jgi:hypothetical protein
MSDGALYGVSFFKGNTVILHTTSAYPIQTQPGPIPNPNPLSSQTIYPNMGLD